MCRTITIMYQIFLFESTACILYHVYSVWKRIIIFFINFVIIIFEISKIIIESESKKGRSVREIRQN